MRVGHYACFDEIEQRVSEHAGMHAQVAPIVQQPEPIDLVLGDFNTPGRFLGFEALAAAGGGYRRAGLMALILSVDPDLRSWEVEDIIKLSAKELGVAGRDEQFGFGRIDCRRALDAASRLGFSAAVTPVFLGSGRECFMRIQARVYNPGINWLRLNSLSIASHTADWSSSPSSGAYPSRFDMQVSAWSICS